MGVRLWLLLGRRRPESHNRRSFYPYAVPVRRIATTFVLALLTLAVLPAAAFAAGAPAIEYSTPSPIRNEEATLRFSIDPEGLETSYEVMYGTEAGNYFPFHEPIDGALPEGNEPVALAKVVPVFFEGGLKPGTEYHWRVVAKNAEGETVGTDQTFTTTNGPTPKAVTGTATEQTLTSASLAGTVDPEGAPLSECLFRYLPLSTWRGHGFEVVTFTSWRLERIGATVPCEETLGEIGSGTEPVAVHAEVSGLEPGPYVWRVEANNQYEEGLTGLPASFGPPGPYTEGASGITATAATVEGTVTKFSPDSAEYRFEYSAGGEWLQTPWTQITEAGIDHEVSAGLTCLQPSTEYHYRLVAANQAGALAGEEKTFTTAAGTPCPPPGSLPGPPPGPPAEVPASPKPCPHRLAKKHPAKAKKHVGKKRGHARKHGRGKACGHFKTN